MHITVVAKVAVCDNPSCVLRNWNDREIADNHRRTCKETSFSIGHFQAQQQQQATIQNYDLRYHSLLVSESLSQVSSVSLTPNFLSLLLRRSWRLYLRFGLRDSQRILSACFVVARSSRMRAPSSTSSCKLPSTCIIVFALMFFASCPQQCLKSFGSHV